MYSRLLSSFEQCLTLAHSTLCTLTLGASFIDVSMGARRSSLYFGTDMLLSTASTWLLLTTECRQALLSQRNFVEDLHFTICEVAYNQQKRCSTASVRSQLCSRTRCRLHRIGLIQTVDFTVACKAIALLVTVCLDPASTARLVPPFSFNCSLHAVNR